MTSLEQTWQQHSNEQLIEHILTRYHNRHREQLIELLALAKTVESVHAEHTNCPAGLTKALATIQIELEHHMQKEENILFPMMSTNGMHMVRGPISVMEAEHVDHLQAVASLESIIKHYKLPADACNTWLALYNCIETFINDIHDHIELENNVLFKRAI